MMWPLCATAKDGGDKGDKTNKADKDDANDKEDDDVGPSTDKAESRFPQPVRVGALIGRQVLEPTEAQHVLGRVETLVRSADGKVSMIMTIGGLFGFDTRLIAVPIEGRRPCLGNTLRLRISNRRNWTPFRQPPCPARRR